MEKVVAITLNYNHSEITLNCINSLIRSDYSNLVVIAIDNGSEPDDYNLLSKGNKSDKVIIERIEKNIGYVGGVNTGLAIAQKTDAAYILVMNNDTRIDSKAISNLVEVAMKHQNLAIVSGKVYNMDEPETLQYIGQKCINHNKFDYPAIVKNMREVDEGQYDQEMEMGMLDDIYWLIPRLIFDKIGFYSTDFFLYGEQNDYALRVVNAGFKLIYTPNAKLWHYHHLTTGDGAKLSKKVMYWQSYATLVLSLKHNTSYYFLRNYFKYIIRLFFDYFKSIYLHDISNDREFIVAKLKGVFYFTLWMFHRKPYNGFNPYN
ncbi:MAG: glycosyltransferase family 2 protein [Lentimicrobium sp.]